MWGVTALDAQLVRFHEHVRSAEPFGRLEFVTGEFDLEAVGIVEINRVHEPAIALDELDASLAQASRARA
jgi:hypothetical protein